MLKKKKSLLLKAFGGIFFLLIHYGCVDPVAPEFENIEGLVFVEGFASTQPGTSFVTISQSAIEFGVFKSVFVRGARVFMKNVNSGETIQLAEREGVYVAPDYFSVATGSTWEVEIILSDGTKIRSYPETVLSPVEITNLKAGYEQELKYVEINGGKFVPGHRISISFTDPVGEQNFYYWTYKTYENLSLCERCYEAYFRDGLCQRFNNVGAAGVPYYDYSCEVDCWRIRYPESIAIFEDKFSDGKTLSNLSIGDLLLYTKENLVIEVEQFSITPAAYQYYKVLKDIIDNNSGFNAPPPAGLIGNMFDPNDSEKFVFGRFTAAAATKASLFIDRSSIDEQPLESSMPLNFERFGDPVPSPIATTAACDESRFRTAIPPNGWISN